MVFLQRQVQQQQVQKEMPLLGEMVTLANNNGHVQFSSIGDMMMGGGGWQQQ
jgi:hypothetical protein